MVVDNQPLPVIRQYSLMLMIAIGVVFAAFVLMLWVWYRNRKKFQKSDQ